MKLFLFSFVTFVVLTVLMFLAFFGGDTGLVIISFCPQVGFIYPLLWVAIYRNFGHLRLMDPRRR